MEEESDPDPEGGGAWRRTLTPTLTLTLEEEEEKPWWMWSTGGWERAAGTAEAAAGEEGGEEGADSAAVPWQSLLLLLLLPGLLVLLSLVPWRSHCKKSAEGLPFLFVHGSLKSQACPWTAGVVRDAQHLQAPWLPLLLQLPSLQAWPGRETWTPPSRFA